MRFARRSPCVALRKSERASAGFYSLTRKLFSGPRIERINANPWSTEFDLCAAKRNSDPNIAGDSAKGKVNDHIVVFETITALFCVLEILGVLGEGGHRRKIDLSMPTSLHKRYLTSFAVCALGDLWCTGGSLSFEVLYESSPPTLDVTPSPPIRHFLAVLQKPSISLACVARPPAGGS